MNEKQSPPYSLFHMMEEGRRLTEALEQAKKQKPQDAEVNFPDDFAPSSSPVKDVSHSGLLQTKAGRLAFYNDHVIEYMEGALERACDLGLPRIFWFFPLQYQSVSDAQYRTIAPMVGALCEGLEEQSDDWLALKCYLCWLTACHALTDGASPLYVAERMFVAGATAREFELSVKNRRHAALGRKQAKNLTELRNRQNSRAATEVEARREAVAELLAQTRLTGGALENWLRKRLEDSQGIKVSARTIRNDLRAIKD